MAQTILQKKHIDLKDIQQSKAWFDAKVKQLRSVSAQQLMRAGQKTTNIHPGGLYSFYYDPIGKDTLPYWDTFPMIFAMSANKETFHGLNMHYLPYPVRFRVFEELLKIHGNDSLDENKRMVMKWQTIMAASKLKPLQYCIKQYRFDQVQSPFMEIKSNEWATALMLPVHKFVGASTATIWSKVR